MMSDLIRREDVIKSLQSMMQDCFPEAEEELDAVVTTVREIPSAEPERRWIPFTMRELTTEEKEEHPEWDYIMDCELPDDGEEILVSNGKFVWSDTFINDGDGCYLDGDTELDGCAWMPLPEPWRGE